MKIIPLPSQHGPRIADVLERQRVKHRAPWWWAALRLWLGLDTGPARERR